MDSSYEQAREALANQYGNKAFDAVTGMSVEELDAWTQRYLSAHRDEPHIKLRAAVFSFLLRNARIRVDAFDWFADHIDTGDIIQKVRYGWHGSAADGFPSSPWVDRKVGFPRLDLSHTSPGWKCVLELGVCGIRDRALKALETASTDESKDFFAAVATVYDAIREYVLRLLAEAERQGATRVVQCLKNIAVQPPRTFHEALQLSYIYNQAQEIEGELVRTQGTFDRLYISYYRHDLSVGTLTREQAKELLSFYFDKFAAQHFSAGHNFCLGGKNLDGSDTCNELTELVLEIFEERKNIDPKLSLRVHRNTPEHISLHAARCVAQGANAIVFANDDTAYPMLLKRGKQPDDLLDFVPVGCYEPAIMGREMCCSMSALINMAKISEFLFSGEDIPQDIDEVVGKCARLLAEAVSETLSLTRRWESLWPEINPSPVLSGSMDACFAKGRDVSHAGAQYNSSGVMCAGLGTLADSLAAINYLVFERKLCTWRELRDMLAANWSGHEKLRLIASRRAPKWGNDLDAADKFAVEIAGHVARCVNSTPNARGGFFQMGCWSIDNSVQFGHDTGATPDGRKSGTPLSKNTGASLAADVRGVTALINSASKLDHTGFPDGSVIDIMLHPSVFRGADGAGVIASLIRAYFQNGGLFIHFNVFDAETLKRALSEPEKYRNLQVRVCGWNSRFIDLDAEMQATFIAQAEALG